MKRKLGVPALLLAAMLVMGCLMIRARTGWKRRRRQRKTSRMRSTCRR